MIEKEIIEYLKVNKPKGINEIVEALHMSKKNKKGNRDILEKLEASGQIIKIKGDRYTVAEKAGLIQGVFEMVKSGFGFVEADGFSVFIHKSNFKNAMSGDTVLVKIFDEGDETRKKEGEIVRVVKRDKDRITGVFQTNGHFGFVKTNSSKDIYVKKVDFNGAKNNDMVVVRIISWGDVERKPEGRVTEVLGNPNDTNVLMKAMIKEFKYSENFPREVRSETTEIKEFVEESEIKKRRDLRKLPIITIDGDDSKDYDDAVYAEKLENGNFRLIVSIADVGYYVKEGSELDREAEKRGNSVYLVDRVLPMFPRELSNGICSLNEGVDRLTFTVEAEIDDKGKIIKEDVYKSVIKSKYRMTYKNVNKILENDEEILAKYSDIKEMVFTMKELYLILRNKRNKRGSIDFDIPEIKVILNNEGKVDRLEKRERGDAEKLIEDFMIFANELVAEKIFWLEVPLVYRIHENPDIQKMKLLNEFLGRFGLRIHGIDDMYPGKFQKILDIIKGKDYEAVLNKMILRSMKQARYSLQNVGHFGLSSKYYAHFTSPIRRYADLIVHRVLSDVVEGKMTKKRIEYLSEYIESVSVQISMAERKAMEAEEESIKIKLTEYMKDKVGEEFEGKIVGLTKNGIFVEILDGVECFINILDIKGVFYFDEKTYKMLEKKSNKEYNIGDYLKVLITRVSIRDLEIDAVIISEKQEGEGDEYSIE